MPLGGSCAAGIADRRARAPTFARRSASPERGPLAQQLTVEVERDVLREQIVDRPQRRDVRRDALVDERGREAEDVALIRRGRAAVHAGFAGVGVDEPRRRRVIDERVADLERPQLAVAEQPGARLGILRVEDAVSGEVHDVVAAVAQAARAVRRSSDAQWMTRVALAIEVDDVAHLVAQPLEPAGDLLGFVARAGQLRVGLVPCRRADRRR